MVVSARAAASCGSSVLLLEHEGVELERGMQMRCEMAHEAIMGRF